MKLKYLGPSSRIQEFLGLESEESVITELPQVDVIISYRYRHIIPWRILRPFRGRIINIHTSLLPNQRGAHPVFWAFMECTSHGVTIHEIDNGVDTGPIIAQCPVYLNESHHTFRTAWDQVDRIAQDFFISLWPALLTVTPQTQPIGGSIHKKSDLERFPDLDWDAQVGKWLAIQEDEALCRDFQEKYRAEINGNKGAFND